MTSSEKLGPAYHGRRDECLRDNFFSFTLHGPVLRILGESWLPPSGGSHRTCKMFLTLREPKKGTFSPWHEMRFEARKVAVTALLR